jgi:truncated hemoglobin YjbI
LGTAIRDSAIMREAGRLAAAGELGNSDAIRLLQIPHTIEDIQEILHAFEPQLSREAKSKLALDALVPPPHNVDNQRYEPLFDKYIITGKTYTTASGAVVPNELQYYNGEMAHLFGECSNVPLVNAALAGSGYRALTLKYPDGGHAAIAQLWLNKFTDTSIRPYAAMFIVVAAVVVDAPESKASIRADSNGASSVLVMLDGSFDPVTVVYENKARMYMFRLLDTTQVAIDVGRERMGTDKRPGTIEMACDGRRLRFSIKDQGKRGVVQGDLELSSNPTTCGSAVAQAAKTAGIALQALPRGAEHCYPAVARIGYGPVLCWQWRSDVAARLQPVMPGSVVFDPSSEEGRTLLAWGFTPKVLGYLPKVRGVVTGMADQTPQQGRNSSIGCRRVANAGSNRFAGVAPAPGPSTVDISPVRPDGARTVHQRANGSTLRPATALQAPPAKTDNAPLLRAVFPGGPAGISGFLPVLRLVGPEFSPRFGVSVRPSVYETHQEAEAVHAIPWRASGGAVSAQSRWAWDTSFLGSLRAVLRKESVGATPDGLRINWHVTEGTFVGPGLDAIVLPGATDWMRIRRDGIAIVNVHACFETRDHVRVYGSYGGIFDLGSDGFARALRDEYDRLPPVVVTPTYATADPRLEWLNRAQCIGVGRVDMTAFRVEFDVYVVRVGERSNQVAGDENRLAQQPASPSDALYGRLGGYDVIAAVADDFLAWGWADKQLSRFFAGHSEGSFKTLRQHVVNLLCELTGGPCVYTGRDMKTAHKGLRVTEADWKVADDLFVAALSKHKVSPQEQSEFMQIIRNMKSLIVEIL